MDLIESRRRTFQEQKSYSAAPFIVYRSAKYSGIRDRAIQVLATYGRFYLIEPLFSWIVGIRNLLYEIFGLLFIICVSPLVLLFFIGLFLFRKLRLYLLRRNYKDLQICEDLSPRNCLKSQPEGMVTSVLWVKGHIDITSLRSFLETRINCSPSVGNLSTLKKTLGSRYTLRVWEEPEIEFNISRHVILAPSKFYSCLITDDPRDLHGFGGKSDKSVLQKYVTSRASVQLDSTLPPWQVTVIPLPSTSLGSLERNRTCVVLRFHRFLLQEKGVLQMLVTSLVTSQGQGGEIEIEWAGSGEGQGQEGTQWISRIATGNKDNCDLFDVKRNETEENARKVGGTGGGNIQEDLRKWITQGCKSLLTDLKLWLELRRKQYQFHTKLALCKSICAEMLDRAKDLRNHEIWDRLKSQMLSLVEGVRAMSYIPVLVCDAFVKSNVPGGNGFRWNEKTNTRHVSWSKPICTDLLSEIRNKTEHSSNEAIILMACSLALRDYYSDNCISNPKKVGITITTPGSEFLGCGVNKNLDLPTRICDILSELKNLTNQLGSYPSWKQLGSSYLHQWSSYFLPRPLTYLVFRKLFKRYPLSFTFVDTDSPFPNMTLWGQTVDEFTFWRAPQSDFCVSITVVKYAGSVRLSVLSPMKCVDSVITQRFCQHLNTIAETVGVPRNRIPYSRKCSPNSSSAASPEEKVDMTFDLSGLQRRKLPARVAYNKRHKSCQSLLSLSDSKELK